jgi:hypothetical protein
MKNVAYYYYYYYHHHHHHLFTGFTITLVLLINFFLNKSISGKYGKKHRPTELVGNCFRHSVKRSNFDYLPNKESHYGQLGHEFISLSIMDLPYICLQGIKFMTI